MCTHTYTHAHAHTYMCTHAHTTLPPTPLRPTHAAKIVIKREKKPPTKVTLSERAKGRITLCQQQKQMG